METSRPPPKPLDLEITIVSGKHLKNVNWFHGDLKPYAIFWLDPDRRLATKSDDSGSTRPVWNERFVIPITASVADAVLNLEVFHSKPLDSPKPLVGSLRIPLKDLDHDSEDPNSNRIRTFELRRPSGRPQGKIRLKLGIRDRPLPDYPISPQPNYYYNTAAPPPPVTTRDYRAYSAPPYAAPPPPPPPASSPYTAPPPAPLSAPAPPHSYHYGSYSDPYSGYYSGYYSQQPPPPPGRPFYERHQSSYGGPSAPVDYAVAQYDQKPKTGRMGMGLGTGLAVGAVAGALGGLALDEGLKYEEDKITDRVESDLASRDDTYSDYHRADY